MKNPRIWGTIGMTSLLICSSKRRSKIIWWWTMLILCRLLKFLLLKPEKALDVHLWSFWIVVTDLITSKITHRPNSWMSSPGISSVDQDTILTSWEAMTEVGSLLMKCLVVRLRSILRTCKMISVLERSKSIQVSSTHLLKTNSNDWLYIVSALICDL
jgi:hypothetical protein